METQSPETEATPPARTGACPFCLRKHLLKARGYARELAEDETREWERDNLLENLLLAEDHADALGADGLRAAIRAARIAAEGGAVPVADCRALPDAAKGMLPNAPKTEQTGDF